MAMGERTGFDIFRDGFEGRYGEVFYKVEGCEHVPLSVSPGSFANIPCPVCRADNGVGEEVPGRRTVSRLHRQEPLVLPGRTTSGEQRFLDLVATLANPAGVVYQAAPRTGLHPNWERVLGHAGSAMGSAVATLWRVLGEYGNMVVGLVSRGGDDI